MEYEQRPNFVPHNGEVCFIDTDQSGLKVKIGDGQTTFAQLPYEFANITTGYYYDSNFYYDQEHTSLIGKYTEVIYVDLLTGFIYTCDGDRYTQLNTVPLATSEQAGIMKLYNTTGSNEDGTMTQKSISEMIDVVPSSERLIIYR